MALERSMGRKDVANSGYYRVFEENKNDEGAESIARLCSKIQACVITNGCELDGKIIPSEIYNKNVPRKNWTSQMLEDDTTGHFAKFQVLKIDCPEVNNKKATELDYLVLTDEKVVIFEIKDGDAFDTKKSQGEIKCLNIVRRYFEERYPEKMVSIRLVLWNTDDITKTSVKAKEMMDKDMLMTGKDFCAKYNIDFEKINQDRMANGRKNRKYFWGEIQNIVQNNSVLAVEFTSRILQNNSTKDVLSELMKTNEEWAKSIVGDFIRSHREWAKAQLDAMVEEEKQKAAQ